MLGLSRKNGKVSVEQFRLRHGLNEKLWRDPYADNLCGLIWRQTDVKLCCAPRVSQMIITKSSDITENEINRRVITHCYHLVCIVKLRADFNRFKDMNC